MVFGGLFVADGIREEAFARHNRRRASKLVGNFSTVRAVDCHVTDMWSPKRWMAQPRNSVRLLGDRRDGLGASIWTTSKAESRLLTFGEMPASAPWRTHGSSAARSLWDCQLRSGRDERSSSTICRVLPAIARPAGCSGKASTNGGWKCTPVTSEQANHSQRHL